MSSPQQSLTSPPVRALIVSDNAFNVQLNHLPFVSPVGVVPQFLTQKSRRSPQVPPQMSAVPQPFQSGPQTIMNTTIPGLTLSIMPEIISRTPNWAPQNQSLQTADVLIFVCSTVFYSDRVLWSGHSNFVPTLCWIDQSNEKTAVETWKLQERARHLRLYSQLSCKENKRRKARVVHYAAPFPISTVEQIKTTLGQREVTEFFSSSTTSLRGLLMGQNVQVTEEFKEKWYQLLVKAKELGSAQRGGLGKRPRSSNDDLQELTKRFQFANSQMQQLNIQSSMPITPNGGFFPMAIDNSPPMFSHLQQYSGDPKWIEKLQFMMRSQNTPNIENHLNK